MKSAMKHATKHVLCALLLLTLYGCAVFQTTPAEVLAKYAAYTPAETSDNGAGLYIGALSYAFEKLTIPVLSHNEALYKSEDNAKATAARLRVFNAENPAQEINAKITTLKGEHPHGNLADDAFYYPIITIEKSANARYLLVYFDGIDATATAATPPLFFLLQFDKESSAVLTETPRVADSLFEDFNI